MIAKKISPAPMVMMGGNLPLIAVVYITMLLEVFISLIMSLIFSVLNSSVWFFMLPAPICEILLTFIAAYDAFIRVNSLYLGLKTVLALVYILQQALFVQF